MEARPSRRRARSREIPGSLSSRTRSSSWLEIRRARLRPVPDRIDRGRHDHPYDPLVSVDLEQLVHRPAPRWSGWAAGDVYHLAIVRGRRVSLAFDR